METCDLLRQTPSKQQRTMLQSNAKAKRSPRSASPACSDMRDQGRHTLEMHL